MNFGHSARVPLAIIIDTLQAGEMLQAAALDVLKVEDSGSIYTTVTAVSGLLNHWLITRQLSCTINGQPVSDVTALKVIPVDGDYGKGIAALENWIMIDKADLLRLFKARNFPPPLVDRLSVIFGPVRTPSDVTREDCLPNLPQGEGDIWLSAIQATTRAFFAEHGRCPSEAEVWIRMLTNPPSGYPITEGKDKARERAAIMGSDVLSHSAFKKRWSRYANKNASQ